MFITLQILLKKFYKYDFEIRHYFIIFIKYIYWYIALGVNWVKSLVNNALSSDEYKTISRPFSAKLSLFQT